MMKKHARIQAETEVDLTPMLDVTFILLIFFLVTSTFVRERTIGLEPPAPEGTAKASETRLVQISLDETQLITINGRMTDIGGVRAALEAIKAETPELSVAIVAHPSAKSGLVVQIRDAIYEAGITGAVGVALTEK
jgi:biopolymer transport protein ExbD